MSQNTTTAHHKPRENKNQTQDSPLRNSPTMSRLLDALESGEDIGHYGQFTFAAVARHFMDDDAIAALLAAQPDMDAEKAQAVLHHIEERGYNPPRRERIIEQQAHQKFQIIPNPDDPDSGNLYRELQFPDGVYEHISDYYEDKTDAREHAAR